MDKKSRELQNKIDAKRRAGGKRGRKAAFTAEQKIDIKAEYLGRGCSMRELAKKHDVCVTTIWRVLRAVAVVLLLSVNVACGVAPAHTDGPFEVFTPTEEIAQTVRDQADAWVAATGLDLRVATGGVPVALVPAVLNEDGKAICGASASMHYSSSGDWIENIEILISTDVEGCPPLALTLRHEMGHALTRGKSDTHAPRGLMSPKPADSDMEIDADALDLVCALAPCS